MADDKGQQTKFLQFSLGGNDYVIPLEIISEVLRYRSVTQVPTVPEVVHGVINLRGSYVPIIDLANRLALKNSCSLNKRSCILMTECYSEEQRVKVGLLVDEVHEAFSLSLDDLSEAPNFGHSVAVELIQGMFRKEGKDYIVLDVTKLMDMDALLALIEQANQDSDKEE